MDLKACILLFSAIAALTEACPSECQCRDSSILCQGRVITQFPSNVPAGTVKLYISNTNISVLKPTDFENFAESLTTFVVRHTDVKEVLPKTFDQTINLKTLAFQITLLQSLPEDLFNSLGLLETLTVADSNIQELPPSLFSQLKGLRALELDKNQLTSVPDGAFNGLHQLQSLRLNRNQLMRLPTGAFADLENLESLYLSNNKISELPDGLFTNLPNLTLLTLHQNELQRLPQGTFGPMLIEQLWLYDNKLRTLEDNVFSNLTNLKLLVLSRNQIDSISTGAFSGLIELTEVSLHTNLISEIKKGTFSNLPKLTNISLEHNKIKTLSADILHGVSHLHQLDLRNNSLQNLDQTFLDSLQIVDEVLLTLNPWKCDQGIIPLRDWLQKYSQKAPGLDGILCQSPTSLNGSVIRDLLDKDLIQLTTQSPAEMDSVTPTGKRRRPHTTPPRKSTPIPTVNDTTKPGQGEDSGGDQISNTSQMQDSHVVIIAVVCTVLIVCAILGVAYWARHKRDSRHLYQQPKSGSVI